MEEETTNELSAISKNIFKLDQFYNLPKCSIENLFREIPDAQKILDNYPKNTAIHMLYNIACDSSYEYHDRFRCEFDKKNQNIENMVSSIQCKRCKEFKVISYTKQLRSADEPETIFTICWNCGHRTKT